MLSSASPDVNLLPPAPTPPPPHHSHKPHGKPGTMGRAACHWGLLGSEARHPGSGLSCPQADSTHLLRFFFYVKLYELLILCQSYHLQMFPPIQ